MNDNIIPLPAAADNESPFDAIRQVRDDGSEYWSARDLMGLMGYARWEDFYKVTRRAEGAARNTNGLEGFSEITEKPESGRPRINYHLSRYACYLVAMNGDPNMAEVAAAQAYFAIRTREAEVRPALPELSPGDWARLVLQEETEKKEALAQLEAAQPAVEYVKQYVGNDDAVTVEAWGAQYGLTRPQAFDLLRDKGFIRRHALGDHWSTKKQRIVTDHEHRAIASKTSGGEKTYNWFTLRPQHNVPRRHNGQVRQTLYIRQAHGVDLAKACGLISKESNDA